MSDNRLKLTLKNQRSIASASSLSKNKESLTKQVPQQKSHKQILSSTKLPNNNETGSTTAVSESHSKIKILLSHEEYSAILKYLQDTYPKCFTSGNTPILPLAIGIHQQLFASANLPFARVKIRKFLKRYTRSKRYRNNLIIGSPRVDLQGCHCGVVTEKEVSF